MSTRIEEVLQGKEANYLLPFLWQHGEDESVIRQEIAHVSDAGIHALCVEARPHPDFLGPKWWQDMDVIMDEARQRGMRVWILDDDHFPTGHAAGRVPQAPLALHRLFARERHIDAIGPQKGASFMLKPWYSDGVTYQESDGTTLLAVIASQRDPVEDRLIGDPIDLTDRIQNDMLYWDLPAGYWRISLIFTSNQGGSQFHSTYLNPLVAESTQILLDVVYEAFYQHYPADFGKTLAGFFSDEPGFYNDRETYSYTTMVGQKKLDLPWRADLLDRLEQAYGKAYRRYLPLLWQPGGEQTQAVRYTYMDVVSRLYGENFTNRIGDWCRAHGVEYIGHIIEDNGAHARLGVSAGHFFRALWGQDMSGIDVVLWQLMPGYDRGTFCMDSGEADGEFYFYGLAKLGSSLGHIDPKKQGRTMCEVFGAYGWCEGLKLMKWITDHMLVRGVNYFVPHAFSQMAFPDPDCPPHFYARGKNPQYRYYHELNAYTNRLSHLLTGGRHIASAAVLYHAEAEWSGRYMPFHKPMRELMQHQIDADVLPIDALINLAEVKDHVLCTPLESYPCLVVPFSEALPQAALQRLADFADQGLPILFVDGLPQHSSEHEDVATPLQQLSQKSQVQVVTLDQLAQKVRQLGLAEVETSTYQPELRCMHVAQGESNVYLFTNEHPYQTVATHVFLPDLSHALVYDAFTNKVEHLETLNEAGRTGFALNLSPYGSQVVLTGAGVAALFASTPAALSTARRPEKHPLEGKWSLGLATAEAYPHFEAYRKDQPLGNLSAPEHLPAFSGTIRYETDFDCPAAIGQAWLDLGEVYETAEVWVNGKACGVRLCPSYRFDVTGALQVGHNHLVVEVTNTLAKSTPEYFSRFAQQEPSGLLGPVVLELG